MSCRDPFGELAEVVLLNLHYWWVEVSTMEPRVIALPAEHFGDGPPPGSGHVSDPTSSFALRRERWLGVLKQLRGVIRRLPPHVREVYRLRYRQGFTRDQISGAMHIHVRTVDKRLAIIRGRVVGCLQRMRQDDRTALCQLAVAWTPALETPEKWPSGRT